MSVFRLCTCLVLGVALLSTSAARAAVILTIDATDRSAVVFASTDAPSAVTYSETGSFLAIVDYPTSGNPAAFVSGPDPLRLAQNNQNVTFIFQTDGRFTLSFGNNPIAFTQGQRALAGAGVADFSDPRWVLPASNQTGDLVLFDSYGVNTGIVVGQYSIVVPEPASLSLLALSGLLLSRRRR